MSIMGLTGYYTPIEAAIVLGKSRTQVCKYVRDGLLPAARVGKNILIEQAKVHSFTPPPRGNPLFRRRKS